MHRVLWIGIGFAVGAILVLRITLVKRECLDGRYVITMLNRCVSTDYYKIFRPEFNDSVYPCVQFQKGLFNERENYCGPLGILDRRPDKKYD